jgi:predicted hotdog family 3-hydroxylacyl-ACP dehydratase
MPDAIESLIPHRAPMRFVDALIDCTETTATATAFFDENHFAVADGFVIEAALVECVAQTVAAAQGQRGKNSGQTGGAGNGMLAAVSKFQIHSRPPCGKNLKIEVRELKRLGPMLLVAGTISCEGEKFVSGELSLYAT